MKRILPSAWLISCLLVLAITLGLHAPGPQTDIMPAFLWMMVALSFPSGLIVAGMWALVIVVLDGLGWSSALTDSAAVGIAMVWVSISAAGYWQWFHACPWLWQRRGVIGLGN